MSCFLRSRSPEDYGNGCTPLVLGEVGAGECTARLPGPVERQYSSLPLIGRPAVWHPTGCPTVPRVGLPATLLLPPANIIMTHQGALSAMKIDRQA